MAWQSDTSSYDTALSHNSRSSVILRILSGTGLYESSSAEEDLLNSTGHNETHSGLEHGYLEDALLAPFLLLLIGSILRHSTHSLPVIKHIPYTMQLLVMGMILGYAENAGTWWPTGSAMDKSIGILANLDPHLMLHIFLPPLVFESAASLEWHIFDKSKWYIMTLAGPGILLSTYLTSQVLNAIHLDEEMHFGADDDVSSCPFNTLPDGVLYEVWPGSAGMLIGVILSATDPVAVVALLKELGVKASLSTGIEGKSKRTRALFVHTYSCALCSMYAPFMAPFVHTVFLRRRVPLQRRHSPRYLLRRGQDRSGKRLRVIR